MSSTWHYRRKALVQFLRANKAVPVGAAVIAVIMIFLAAKGNGWGSNHGLLSDSLLTVATLIVTYLIVDVVIGVREARSEKARERAVISSLMFPLASLLKALEGIKGTWEGVREANWSESELSEEVGALADRFEPAERQWRASLLHAQMLGSLDAVRIVKHCEELINDAFDKLRFEELLGIDRLLEFHLRLLMVETWLWLWRNTAEAGAAAYVVQELLREADETVAALLGDWKVSVNSVVCLIGPAPERRRSADDHGKRVLDVFWPSLDSEFATKKSTASYMTTSMNNFRGAVAFIECKDDQFMDSFERGYNKLGGLIDQREKRYNLTCKTAIDFRGFVKLWGKYELTCLRDDSVFANCDVSEVEFWGQMPAEEFKDAETTRAKFRGEDLGELLQGETYEQ